MTPPEDPAVLEVKRHALASKLADLHEAEERTYAELVLVEHRLRRLAQRHPAPASVTSEGAQT